jgi:non-ribosomal peptide synthetase component F
MLCLPPKDRVLVSRFGRGSTASVPYSLIHEAFEKIAGKHPTITVATSAGRRLTYLQLDVAANRIAHYLISSGLRPGSGVCLIVQRSFEMLVGIFTIPKSGCQYVPIDGGVTSEQAFTHIFTDSNARFILCLPRFWNKIKRVARRDVVIFALTMDAGAFCLSTKPSVQVSHQDGAYAIHTSGNFSSTSKSQ